MLWQDLKYGLRGLRKDRVFTLVALLTSALGIGANTAIFTLANALLFRTPLGINHPQQIVLISRSQNGSDFNEVSYPDYVDFRDASTTFLSLAAYRRTDLQLTGDAFQEPLSGMLVSGNYFQTLGTRADRGRLIMPEDNLAPGASPVVVISHVLWQQRFASDPNIVGRVIHLNAFAFTIVGVTEQGFAGTEVSRSADIWVPLTMYSQAVPTFYERRLEARQMSWLTVLGRLKPGVTVQAAHADLNAISRRLEQTYPNIDKRAGVTLMAGLGLQPERREEARRRMELLMAIAGLVLMIASANVASLFLARAVNRRKELAVRRALGASTFRIVRQLLAEALVISIGGGVLGLLMAVWSKALLLRFDVLTGIRLAPQDLQLNARVLLFALAISIVTALIFALVPMVDSSRLELQPTLRASGVIGASRSRLRALIVVAEIAVTVVVLIAAGLFERTLFNTQSVDPGFNADRILMIPIDVGRRGLGEGQGRVFYDQLIERVQRIPGVSGVSLAITAPLGGQWRTGVRAETQSPGDPEIACDYNIITPGHFQTLGITLESGRDFTPQDQVGSAPVVIVGEEFARREFPHDSPIGKRISIPRFPGDTSASEIVGLVKDVKYEQLTEAPRPYFYVPFAQRYQSEAILFVRSSAPDASVLGRAVPDEVRALDRNMPVYGVRTLGTRLNASLGPPRSAATLLGVFGLLALLLASVGLYGVVGYSVAHRTREIGVRMALGAQRRDVLRLVVRQGMMLIALGIAAGLATAFAVTRLTSSLLFGVSPTDPTTLAVTTVLLAAVGSLACLIPARRATRVDPLVALRYE